MFCFVLLRRRNLDTRKVVNVLLVCLTLQDFSDGVLLKCSGMLVVMTQGSQRGVEYICCIFFKLMIMHVKGFLLM